MILEILIGIEALAIAGVFYMGYRIKKFSEQKSTSIPTPIVNTDTRPFTQELDKIRSDIQDLPSEVLTVITGSGNTHKGKLGELIGYIELKAEYDRIIPMSSIVDFICIKLPTENDPGSIDFIDIKTGSSARLSKDQKDLKKLVDKKLISFKTIKINTIEGYEDDRTDTDPEST